MSLQNPDLTILDFDGAYRVQSDLCARFPHHWVDFHDLRQTNLYCSLESFHAISKALPPADGAPVTLLGCGNYHYVALALLSRLQKPFTLILVDHHTDSAEGALPSMISCGSWIHHAFLEQPQLACVIMTGPSEAALRHLKPSTRERILAVPDLAQADPAWLLAQIPTDDIYLSIDKDAFAPTLARTNWDQGNLRLDCLLPHLRSWLRTKTVRGIDLCGEWPATPLDLLQPDILSSIGLNEHTNEVLLETFLAAG